MGPAAAAPSLSLARPVLLQAPVQAPLLAASAAHVAAVAVGTAMSTTRFRRRARGKRTTHSVLQTPGAPSNRKVFYCQPTFYI